MMISKQARERAQRLLEIRIAIWIGWTIGAAMGVFHQLSWLLVAAGSTVILIVVLAYMFYDLVKGSR